MLINSWRDEFRFLTIRFLSRGGANCSIPMDHVAAKSIGMVIGARAARACDVCGRERARWYCAADEAYLCERCDGSVHSANTVAKRHERVRLGPNGAPMKIERSSCGVVKKDDPFRPWHHGTRKKPRTSRHHLAASRSAKAWTAKSLADVKVKPEPGSPEAENLVPENHLLDSFLDCKSLQDDFFLHEVPIYTPIVPECLPGDGFDLAEEKPACESPFLVCADTESPNNADDEVDFLVPGNCIDIDHFLDSGADIRDLDVEMDCVIGEGQEMQCMEGMGMLGFAEEGYAADTFNSGVLLYGGDTSEGEQREVCLDGESPRSWLCKVKVESPPDQALTEADADRILGWKLESVQLGNKPKLGLKLNYDEVLNAWSDKGSLWMDGHRPQTVADESSLDGLGGFDTGLVPDLSYNSSCSTYPGDHWGQVPVIKNESICMKSGAREARVMRYREKRRTRLFSKKIRYEVRKLNAEKRPRMKGRFVKRTPGIPWSVSTK